MALEALPFLPPPLPKTNPVSPLSATPAIPQRPASAGAPYLQEAGASVEPDRTADKAAEHNWANDQVGKDSRTATMDGVVVEATRVLAAVASAGRTTISLLETAMPPLTSRLTGNFSRRLTSTAWAS